MSSLGKENTTFLISVYVAKSSEINEYYFNSSPIHIFPPSSVSINIPSIPSQVLALHPVIPSETRYSLSIQLHPQNQYILSIYSYSF